MGEEIYTHRFSQEDFKIFDRNLRLETLKLSEAFRDHQILSDEKIVGLELETWLVDQLFNPLPINNSFLSHATGLPVFAELSKFNVEINSSPFKITRNILSSLRRELLSHWQACEKIANELQAQLMMVGILPTLKEEYLTLKNMSNSHRYRALNEQIFKLKNGTAMQLDIQGKDRLQMTQKNVMLEAATTSLQIHFQVDPKKAHRFYNASLILSAPMIGIAANSPFLFGKELWDETRIPLFEQAVDLGGHKEKNHFFRRVTFGSGYLQKDIMEHFFENLHCYPVLIPMHSKNNWKTYSHLRLHNGTIWRWNRPVLGFNKQNKAHLRIEHRVLPAGPTLVDIVANCALFIGLMEHFGNTKIIPESQIEFRDIMDNFYLAAKKGLKAKIKWFQGKERYLDELFSQELLPQAIEGLQNLNVNPSDIDFYLKDILPSRTKTGQNGASWQKKYVQKHGLDFQKLSSTYKKNQESENPVHSWSLS